MRNWIQIIKLQGYRYLFFVFIAVGAAIVCSSCVFNMSTEDIHDLWSSFNPVTKTEQRCRLTLRALGSTELAYQDQNLMKTYGSWEVLHDPQNSYIQEGYTKSNIIDEYEIAVFEVKPASENAKKQRLRRSDSTFTIVAIPRNKKLALRTFAIDDSQIPRVWVGDDKKWSYSKIALNDPELWEPLR